MKLGLVMVVVLMASVGVGVAGWVTLGGLPMAGVLMLVLLMAVTAGVVGESVSPPELPTLVSVLVHALVVMVEQVPVPLPQLVMAKAPEMMMPPRPSAKPASAPLSLPPPTASVPVMAVAMAAGVPPSTPPIQQRQPSSLPESGACVRTSQRELFPARFEPGLGLEGCDAHQRGELAPMGELA
jgi:hypothetical protein